MDGLYFKSIKSNTMSYLKLPQRVFNSPLVEFANFEDGTFVNLIKLNKPYADGTNYAVYENTNSSFCANGLFKSYEKAKKRFDKAVDAHVSLIRDSGVIDRHDR